MVLWSYLPPAGGGLTVVARRLAGDPDLNERFRMEFRGTVEAAPEAVGRFTFRNIARAVRDAAALYRVARGAVAVQIFSSGHTSTVLARAILLAIGARLARAKVLVFLGSGRLYPPDPRDFVPTRGMPQLYRLLSRLVSVFVIIDGNAEAVVGPMVGATPLALIPPPVDSEDLKASRPPATERPVIVYAGRITREKGALELLEACDRLVAAGCGDWELRLVGPVERSTPGELQEIESAAAALGRVTFVGWLDDISGELAGGDLYVSASHREGLSGSIVEAAMSGLPLVATDAGATRTVVRDGETGFLVEVGDVAGLAENLRTLVEDADLRREMGERARALAIDLYSREHIAHRYGSLLAGLIGGTGLIGDRKSGEETDGHP